MTGALIIHSGAGGDFIMSLRIVATVREVGAEHVTVLGRPFYTQLAGTAEGLDAYLDIDTGQFHVRFSEEPDVSAHVAKALARFDLAVNMLAGEVLVHLPEEMLIRTTLGH